jgi:hypothetical protein
MLARRALVHQTLVSGSRRTDTRCRRYLRLIDPAARVWFHALLEIAMEALERLTHRVTVRGGLIVVAMLVT